MDVNNAYEYFLSLTRSWEDEETISNIDCNLVSEYNCQLLEYRNEVIKVEESDDLDLDTNTNNNLIIKSI